MQEALSRLVLYASKAYLACLSQKASDRLMPARR
jgi:hypothetical protein